MTLAPSLVTLSASWNHRVREEDGHMMGSAEENEGESRCVNFLLYGPRALSSCVDEHH